MIKIINNNKYKAIWNKAAVNPMQSWQWGEAKKKTGVEVIRIAENNGKCHSEFISESQSEKNEFQNKFGMINAFQITFHKIPYTNYTVGYLPRSVIPSKDVIEFIISEAKKRNCIFVKIEPYIRKSEILNSKSETNSKFIFYNSQNNKKIEQYNNLIKSSHPLFPEWTQVIDLTKSEQELLKSMKPKTRYNIKLAEKHGVKVKEMTNDEGFNIYSKLYFETCQRQNYKGHNNFYHKTVFENMKNDISHILIAFYKDIPLVAYQLFLFNDIIYYPYGGSNTEHKNVMAPNAMMWEAIKFGKTKGAKLFDMWGSLSSDFDQSDPWAGFTKFKQGYGGEFLQFIGSYDLVINKYLYKLYGLAIKLRNKII